MVAFGCLVSLRSIQHVLLTQRGNMIHVIVVCVCVCMRWYACDLLFAVQRLGEPSSLATHASLVKHSASANLQL